jgi:transposase
MLDRLGVIALIDEVVGARRRDAGASVGTYLALAALGRLVDPCSKLGFEKWWRTTAADRFTKISASVLDHRKFWDAMHTVSPEDLARIEHRIALAMVATFDLDICSLALDMTNFATYIDTTNDHAPIAARGKAKQKRADLRLVGLGLVITRDGGIPLVSHAYPGNRPDVTQFATMIDLLVARHTALAAALGSDPDDPALTTTTTTTPPARTPPHMTVVFDAGQNSAANLAHLHAAGLGFVGPIPPSDCPDLLARPATDRHVVDSDRFPGLTALEDRRHVFGADRRVVLTHSATLHTAQTRSFDQTLTKASAKLSTLADTLARGHTRRSRDTVTAEITQIVNDPWVRRVVSWQLTGDTPAEHRLTFDLNETARTDLEEQVFGKRVLMTDRDQWSTADVIAGYRSQSEAEFGFRQLKDPHIV